jgi:hypothetical protein
VIYVFDTSSLSELKHFYPVIFKSIWTELNMLVQKKGIISTKEVWNELQRGNPDQHTNTWLKSNKELFTTPSVEELQFVAQILTIPHFQNLIGQKQRLKGDPVADPFVIACARIRNGTVVTEEQYKPNAAKIPNVCQHFGLPCIDLKTFMQHQKWSF